MGYLPNGTHSDATAVSANGSVIVGNGDAADTGPPTSSAAFRSIAGAGLLRVDPLPGSTLCSAGGVSGDGATVAGTCLLANNTGFRWTAATGPVALSRFGGGSNQQGTAVAISLDGAVVVGTGHPALTGAVLWAADGSAAILGKLAGDAEAMATSVSRDGSVVVGFSVDNAGSRRAFRWTQQTGMVALSGNGDGFPESVAAAVSGDGRVIVGWSSVPGGDVALIWDADHGMRVLNAALQEDYQTQLPGWKLARATGISADARAIVGYGTNPQGQTEAWLVRLEN